MAVKKGTLTPKQKAFCETYVLNHGNATAAARQAGYNSEDNALSVVAFENLRKPNLIAEIERLRKEIGQEFIVSAEEIVGGLREVAKRALEAEEVFDRDGSATGVFQSDLSAANRALELLGKTVGLFVDRRELSGANGEPLQVHVFIPPNGRD